MAQTLATPGVYIEERNAFPNSVAAIPTAVPAFIGYTEKTTKDGESLINKPVRITSLGEFHTVFGAGFSTTFVLKEAENPSNGYDLAVGGKFYSYAPEKKSRFIFYDSIRMFFANGGSTCYIVSAGAYMNVSNEKPTKPAPASKDGKTEAVPASGGAQINEISKKALENGLSSLITVEEPTMVVIPEAVMLDEGDCFALQQDMVLHCGFKMKNRFAILDVYNGFKARTYDKADVITRFREGIGSNFLAFGAAYYPYVQTAIVQNEEVSFKNISNLDLLVTVLSKEADLIFDNPKKAEEAKIEIKKLEKADNVESLNQTLKAISPAFKTSIQAVLKQLNLLPPSAAMAGLYSMVDNSRGVWKAPANISIGSVIAPAINMTNDDQEDLNVTVTGKSVNAIRSFVGQGTLVWGARTLDGNSQDWKYVNVRRTMIYIEQSIKYAAKSYVYEPNTSNTWVLIKSMISSFLNTVWKLGGLAGVTPGDAYEVEVGLGTTMTPNDILDGIMKITVKVAVTRPAEFIVITFEQKMQQS
jgi:uncharacterized protein